MENCSGLYPYIADNSSEIKECINRCESLEPPKYRYMDDSGNICVDNCSDTDRPFILGY